MAAKWSRPYEPVRIMAGLLEVRERREILATLHPNIIDRNILADCAANRKITGARHAKRLELSVAGAARFL
jgi:hypothetical protein